MKAVLLLFFGASLAYYARGLDPRCADATAKGQITCTIDQPNVQQPETVYPEVAFAQGDTVIVGAGGCVQTGGLGKTWKLYVDSPDAGGKYHGLIRIPTATPGTKLIRIKDIVGRQLTVTGPGTVLLHLGYEDDDFSDNGYYDHDDGTGDQCKKVGPAQVRILIFRGVPPPSPPSKFNFNLESTATAPGGLPFNPQWAWQQRVENLGAIPDTSLCHNFSRLTQQGWVPDFADCTDQTGPGNVDRPDGFNNAICGQGGGDFSFVGHVNWFPVTFEGRAIWGEHNTDDDYTFEFKKSGNPLSVNGREGIHVEFDSDETIDNFQTDEWNLFHQAVRAAEQSKANCEGRPCDPAALQEALNFPKKLFNGFTILTGLFGLDCEHDCKAELHPLYAIATRRDDYENDASDEVWLMFVRNIGDEGYCSSLLWAAPFTSYTFRLPWREGMESVKVLWGIKKSQFEGTDGTSGPSVTYIPFPVPGFGVYVTFTLPRPPHRPLINGALHLQWVPGDVPVKSRPIQTEMTPIETAHPLGSLSGTVTDRSREIDEAERRIRAVIDQLPPAQRSKISNARRIAGVRPLLRPLPQGGPAQKVATIPAAPRIAVRINANAGSAAQKAQQDEAQMRALCGATGNAPIGLPSHVCKGPASDNR